MRKIFIYPTIRNTILLLILLQMLLALFSFYVETSPIFWLKFEAIIFGILCLWPLKPQEDMDECEKAVELKWKGRMLEWTYPLIIVPIAILLLKPSIGGWIVLNSFTFPVFAVFVTFSILLKYELGSFFYYKKQ